MSREELKIVLDIRDALQEIPQRLSELAEAVLEVAKVIERAAEDMRDAK